MTGWRKRTIVDLAREAGFEQVGHDSFQELTARMEAFAKLVRKDEREKFLGALRQLHDSYSLASDPSGLKERGQA
jgi:hypothetical protein